MYMAKPAHLLQQGVSAYLIAFHKYHGYQQLSFVFIILSLQKSFDVEFSYIIF